LLFDARLDRPWDVVDPADVRGEVDVMPADVGEETDEIGTWPVKPAR
jgi:hypothetical protein